MMEEIKKSTDTTQKEHVFLPVLPLKNVVALPKGILPVIVGRDISIQAVEKALRRHKEIFVTAQKRPDIEVQTAEDLFQTGIRATILQVSRMPNGSLKILVEGIIRSRIVEAVKSEGFIGVLAQDLSRYRLPKGPQKKLQKSAKSP